MIYEKETNDFHKRVLKLQEYIKENPSSNIKMFFHMNTKIRYDLYVILSDDIDMIRKYIEKIKNRKKLVILTKNKNIDHIIGCVNITKNMFYLYSSDEYLITKLKKVYESNLAKYN